MLHITSIFISRAHTRVKTRVHARSLSRSFSCSHSLSPSLCLSGMLSLFCSYTRTQHAPQSTHRIHQPNPLITLTNLIRSSLSLT